MDFIVRLQLPNLSVTGPPGKIKGWRDVLAVCTFGWAGDSGVCCRSVIDQPVVFSAVAPRLSNNGGYSRREERHLHRLIARGRFGMRGESSVQQNPTPQPSSAPAVAAASPWDATSGTSPMAFSGCSDRRAASKLTGAKRYRSVIRWISRAS